MPLHYREKFYCYDKFGGGCKLCNFYVLLNFESNPRVSLDKWKNTINSQSGITFRILLILFVKNSQGDKYFDDTILIPTLNFR